MGGKLHPALAFARLVEGWSPGIFSKVDRWRETESSAPWQFMTFRQCRAWISDWLKHNPAPEEGALSAVLRSSTYLFVVSPQYKMELAYV